MRKLPSLCLCAATLLAASARAQLVVGMISDDNVFYALTSFPTTVSSTSGLSDFRVAGAASQDQLFQATWYYRLGGDLREFAFNSGAAQGALSSVYSGARVVHTWANADNRNIAATRDIRVVSAGPSSGFAIEKLTVTNNTGSAILLNLFAYADYDQCGAAGDSAIANPTANKHSVTDTGACAVGEAYAPGADNYEVAAWPLVRNKMTDTALDDFSNTGLPFGPNDYSGGWQWKDRAVAPGASFTAYLILGEDVVHSACLSLADAQPYGLGKAGSNGTPSFDTSVLPLLGRVARLTIDNGFAGRIPCVVVGAARADNPSPPFGTILVDLGSAALINGSAFDATNRSVTQIVIPNGLDLCSVSVHIQAFVDDPGAVGSVSHTSGLTWTLGGVH